MEYILKAKLVDKIQEFLDDEENADLIGATLGAWQDDSLERKNATLMAESAFCVLKAQHIQYELGKRFEE
jgi:hypothetical protein